MSKNNVRNKCTLECSAEDYASFYVEAYEYLYESYNPLDFMESVGGGELSKKLSHINIHNPMGVPDSELRLPVSSVVWSKKLSDLERMPAFLELSSNKVIAGAVNKYLKKYRIIKGDSLYPLFQIRFFCFLSFLFASYISESSNQIDDLVVTNEKREKVVEAAVFLKNNISDFAMRTKDEKSDLKLLLKRFVRYNSKSSMFCMKPLKKEKDSGSTDHALRLLAIRLTTVFLAVHKKSHSSLVKVIAKSVCRTVGATTVDRYVAEAKRLLVSSDALLDHYVPIESEDTSEQGGGVSGSSFSDAWKDLKKRREKYVELLELKKTD